MRDAQKLDVTEYVSGLADSNTLILSKAITLLESKRPRDIETANELLDAIMPFTGKARRIGITGIPGVGKSTLIDALGREILANGKHRIAVLGIDPTSPGSKGSILGDKTRMQHLTGHEDVFIRPTPSGSTLGGVGDNTYETILLCEAAGYDTVIIETLGVGQGEHVVRNMVDYFLLVMQPAAGDELQGIKKGIMEMADCLVINKADGALEEIAEKSKTTYQSAIELNSAEFTFQKPQVLTCSATTHKGIRELHEHLIEQLENMKMAMFLDIQRQKQAVFWLHSRIRSSLMSAFYTDEKVKTLRTTIEDDVMSGKKSIFEGSTELISAFFEANQSDE